MGWYAVYEREMLLMRKKVGKFGYVFSALLLPLIYLFAFGWGLGGKLEVPGGYVPFLAKGMAALTVMLNAFQQTALSVSVGRFYFGTFQTLVLSPVSFVQIAAGIGLAGVTRGVAAGGAVYLIAVLFFGAPMPHAAGIIGLALLALCFAALGISIGMWVKNPDALSLVINFLITPMTFFCGSFFPLENLPAAVQYFVRILPLSLANRLLHAGYWSPESAAIVLSLTAMTGILFWLSVWQLRRYAE